jgi:hypothetical protein
LKETWQAEKSQQKWKTQTSSLKAFRMWIRSKWTFSKG